MPTDLSHSALLAASIHISQHTVGLVRIGDGGRMLFGSGTLVSTGEFAAILTASSVLERLPRHGRLGIALRTELNQISLDTGDLVYRVIPGAKELGLVMLAPSASRRFTEYKRFVDLGAGDAVADDLSTPWCVNGFTDELTTTDLPLDCFDMVCGYTNVTCAQTQEIKHTSDGVELTVSRFNPEGADMSFHGLVGGGVWLANNELASSEPDAVLAGVVIDGPSDRLVAGTVRCTSVSQLAAVKKVLLLAASRQGS